MLKMGSSGIECNSLNCSGVDLFQSLQIMTLFVLSFKLFPTLFYLVEHHISVFNDVDYNLIHYS